MREILFRAKQHYTKEWLYGAVVKDGDECLITVGEPDGLYKQKMTVVEESTVGQFTGLTDKNGNKIFEGDIVKDNKSIGIIKYFESIGCFVVIVGNDIWNLNENDPNRQTKLQYTEVIGNIHDNKMEDIK